MTEWAMSRVRLLLPNPLRRLREGLPSNQASILTRLRITHRRLPLRIGEGVSRLLLLRLLREADGAKLLLGNARLGHEIRLIN